MNNNDGELGYRNLDVLCFLLKDFIFFDDPVVLPGKKDIKHKQ